MSNENRALGQRWMEEVWNRRRSETIDQLLDANAVGHMEGVEVRGPEEFKKVRAALLDAFPDFRITIEDVVSEGENVVIRWRVQGTHSGGGLGFPASGRTADFRGITWQKFRGGKLVEGWDSWNQGALLAKLNAPK